jgi:hypothetical protein
MKFSKPAALIPICFALTGCLATTTPSSIGLDQSSTVQPGTQVEMLPAMASTLVCDPAGLTWSIQEQVSNPSAWNASVDGSVNQSGVLSAPKCGSAWVGATIHVQAVCASNGKTGVAAVTTAQEILHTLVPGAAIVSQCGEAACRSNTPTDIQVRPCMASEAPTTVDFFARLDFTCGPVFSPALPANYSTLPICAF